MRVLLALPVLMLLAGCTATTPTATTTSTTPVAGPGPLEVFALADTHHGERFQPTMPAVHVGDTLTFKVQPGASHTVDFGNDNSSPIAGLSKAHSGNLDPGATFQVTFTAAGDYPFHCQYHLPGMTGTVHVA